MSGEPSRPAENPRRLEDFPARSFDKLRYGDTDRQGHVNNAVFSTFLETGRVELLRSGGTLHIDPGCEFVIASLQLDFLGEVLWPGQVDIGTRVVRVGRSSVHLEQVLFQDGRVTARAQTVMVQVSGATHRSQPFSPGVAAHFAALQA